MLYKIIVSLGDQKVFEYEDKTILNNDFVTASRRAVTVLFGTEGADNVTCFRMYGENMAEDNFFYAEKG
jgi:hypothetical protein